MEQSCANYVQHIERLSRASVMLLATWYQGTAQLLSLTELKLHLFELFILLVEPLNRWRKGGNRSTRRKPLATSCRHRDTESCRYRDMESCRYRDSESCRRRDIESCSYRDIESCRHTDIENCRHGELQTLGQPQLSPAESYQWLRNCSSSGHPARRRTLTHFR